MPAYFTRGGLDDACPRCALIVADLGAYGQIACVAISGDPVRHDCRFRVLRLGRGPHEHIGPVPRGLKPLNVLIVIEVNRLRLPCVASVTNRVLALTLPFVASDVLEELQLLLLQKASLALGLVILVILGATDSCQLLQLTAIQREPVHVVRPTEEHGLPVLAEHRLAFAVFRVREATGLHGPAVDQIDVTVERRYPPAPIAGDVAP